MITLRTRVEWLKEWVRRFISYQDTITWFGNLGIAQAFGKATADLAELTESTYTDVKRRNSIRACPDDDLDDVMAEYGTERLPASRAIMTAIVSSHWEQVMSISLGTGPVGAGDEIEVATPTEFAVADSIRIRNGTGATTEVRAIVGITVGTGPGGGDEIEVLPLVGAYTPATDDVAILLRVTIPVGSILTTASGPQFQTLSTVTAGDLNPIFNGESSTLALADKLWCECTTAGITGNVPAEDVVDFSPTIAGIESVTNPEKAEGGEDEEASSSARYRTAHRPDLANQETQSWLEALASAGNHDVLRAIITTASSASTMAAKILKRNGGTFSAAEILALEEYMNTRVRSYMVVDLYNVTMTAVQVEAQVTLSPGFSLRDAWQSAADAIVLYLDWRRWSWGVDVPASDLFDRVSDASGVATVDIPTFLPASNVTVAADSLPWLVNLSMLDTETGETINAALATGF